MAAVIFLALFRSMAAPVSGTVRPKLRSMATQISAATLQDYKFFTSQSDTSAYRFLTTTHYQSA